MSSIFPSYQEQKENSNLTLPLAIEIAINFETGEPIIKNGDFVTVEKDEAIRVWCYYALKTSKNIFLAVSKDYGQTFEELINDSEADAKIKNKIKECLLLNKYIKNIKSVKSNFDENGSLLNATIKLETVYSKEIKINV